MKIKKFIKAYWYLIVAFVLPWVIALIHSFAADSWVTGNGDIITGDLQAQIVPICYELWDKIHDGESLCYTWHMLNGIDFNALVGYVFSPFSLIMLALPRNCIPDYITIIMILKWALSSFSMTFFFYHTKHNMLKCQKKTISLFLGLAYALSNAVVSYIVYIQFMDVLICFPFLLLMLEKFVDEGRWKGYFLLLVFCMISNTYLAYQICIFLVIWFFIQLKWNTPNKFKRFLSFAGVSTIAALICSGIIYCSANLSRGRLDSYTMSLGDDYIQSVILSVEDFVKQFFILEPIAMASDREPNIFCSIAAVVLVLLFSCVKIGKRRKIYMLLIGVLFVASFFSGGLSMVWHMFNEPNGVYHRFMYLFVFYILFMLLYVFNHIEDIRLPYVLCAAGITIGAGAYTFFKIQVYDNDAIYVATALLLGFYIVMLVFYCKKSLTSGQIVMLFAVCGILELCINSYFAFKAYDNDKFYGEGGYNEEACQILERAELNPGERIVISYPGPNLGLMAKKDSDSGFISAINTDNKILHEKLGMASNSRVEFLSRGASPLINLLFNMRYGLGESSLLFSDAELQEEGRYMQLYRLNRLAGLGYMVDSSVTEWNYENKNCFQFQNDFVEKTVGGEPIFTSVVPEMTCSDAFGNVQEREESYFEKGAYVYDIENICGNVYDARECVFEADRDMDLYMFAWVAANYNLSIFVDGEMIHQDARSFEQSSYHIGEIKKGQRVVICAIPDRDFIVGEHTILLLVFGNFEESAYEKAYEKLTRNVYDIEIHQSDYIKGTITAEKDSIMMTSIPADPGFTVYVDGTQTQYEVIGGAMIGVPLEQGQHTVEFKYATPYLLMGWTVFGCGMAVYVLICLIDYRRQRSKNLTVVEE